MENSSPNSPASALAQWLNSLELSSNHPKINHLSDIQDGEILWLVLATLDPNFFRAPRPSSMSGTMSDAWVLRFTSFKKMEELRKVPKEGMLVSPNLQKIAKDGDVDESVNLSMIILTLATLVQPDLHVPKIQALPTWAQTALMLGIQSVSQSFETEDSQQQQQQPQSNDVIDTTSVDPELRNAHERLMKDYQLLRLAKEESEHRLKLAEQELLNVQERLEEATSEQQKLESHSSKRQSSRGFDSDEEEADHQSERQRFQVERDELKSEIESLGVKLDESELREERLIEEKKELKKRVDELSDLEEQNRGLRDQLDELRHDAERARKLENVIEKYKKKLDESADLRRQLKTLEEQNSEVLDKNSKLEDEYRKVSAFKPLMEQYKSQIASLESTLSSQKRERDRMSYEIETLSQRLRVTEEERDREGEELALYEARVKELEDELPLRNHAGRRKSEEDSSVLEDSFDDRVVEEETGIIAGIGGELNDAIEGRTMTSLKLELRKLKRQLKILRASAQDPDETAQEERLSRLVVLENLLEDSNRMKRKYEEDYLNVYREKLVISNQLEEIRSGKSGLGDGPEASIALRLRLNETVDELEKLKAEHAELSVAHEQVVNELTVAKSDLHLVGKDQLEILSSLRESVSTEKVGLTNEVERLKKELSNLRDQLTMKTDQIQCLLLEKISLQSDSIDQRETMLKREREFSKGGSSGEETVEVKVLERVCKEKEEEVKMLKSKLEKARLFIVDQHKMIQGQASGGGAGAVNALDVSSLTNSYEEMEQALKAEIVGLKEEIERLKTANGEMNGRYEKELRLMGSAWHNLSQQKLRETIALNHNRKEANGRVPNSNVGGGVGGNIGFGGILRPQSWVKVQRDRLMNRDGLVSRFFGQRTCFFPLRTSSQEPAIFETEFDSTLCLFFSPSFFPGTAGGSPFFSLGMEIGSNGSAILGVCLR